MRRILLATLSAAVLLAAPVSAQQERVTIPSVGPGGVATLPAATELRRTCFIADVAAFSNRVHVHCAPAGTTFGGGLYTRDYVPPPEPDAGIVYFAVGAASDAALADRVIALATSATQQNRQVQILYRTSAAENPPGCQANDCRRLIGLTLIVQP